MATKKGKKSKGVTISFQEFTARVEGEGAPAAGQNIVYAPKKPVLSSWADEVEEDELITEKERIVLPSAPRASRGPAYDDSEIPRTAPFQINLGNLNYDIDDEDIYKFFRDLDIVELKLPRDRESNRIKGFGFVVFSTRDELIEALIKNEQMLRGRPVRIALGQDRGGIGGSSQGGYDRRGGGGMRGDRPPPEDEGVDNWRTVMGSEQGSGQGGGGGERGGMGGGGERGGGFDRGERGGGGFDRDRRGGDSGMTMDRSEMRPPGGGGYESGRSGGGGSQGAQDYGNRRYGGGGGYEEPRRSRGYDEDRSRGGGSPGGSTEELSTWRGGSGGGPRGVSPRRGGPDGGGSRDYGRRGGEDQEEEEFVRPATVPRVQVVMENVRGTSRPERAERPADREQRAERPERTERSGESAGQPQQRKKLVLQPRSNLGEAGVPEVKNYANIFGEAKPVDTSKREMEIEEKLHAVKVEKEVAPEDPAEQVAQDADDIGGKKKYRLLTRDVNASEKYVDITSSGGETNKGRQRGVGGGGGMAWRQQQTSRRTPPRNDEDDYNNRRRNNSGGGGGGRRRSVEYHQDDYQGPRGGSGGNEKDRDSHSEPEDDRDFKQQHYKREGQVGSGGRQTERYNTRGGDYRVGSSGGNRGGGSSFGSGPYSSSSRRGGGGERTDSRDSRDSHHRRMEDNRGDTRRDDNNRSNRPYQQPSGGGGGGRPRGSYDNSSRSTSRVVDKDGFEYNMSGPRSFSDSAPQIQQQQPVAMEKPEGGLKNKFAFLSNSSGEED